MFRGTCRTSSDACNPHPLVTDLCLANSQKEEDMVCCIHPGDSCCVVMADVENMHRRRFTTGVNRYGKPVLLYEKGIRDVKNNIIQLTLCNMDIRTADAGMDSRCATQILVSNMTRAQTVDRRAVPDKPEVTTVMTTLVDQIDCICSNAKACLGPDRSSEDI